MPRPWLWLPLIFLAGLVCATVTREKWAVRFVDTAAKAGLTVVNVSGEITSKKYILEMNGSGLAFIDYNRDGYVDLFLVNGTRLAPGSGATEPTGHLYRNNGDGTFTDVTREAGLAQSGWGQGACVGDFDNDGFDDLFVTYYGQNHLYRNLGNGSFADVTESAGLKQEKRWSTGCAFVDYDLDGKVDLFIANYVIFEKEEIPLPGGAPDCKWNGQP